MKSSFEKLIEDVVGRSMAEFKRTMDSCLEAQFTDIRKSLDLVNRRLDSIKAARSRNEFIPDLELDGCQADIDRVSVKILDGKVLFLVFQSGKRGISIPELQKEIPAAYNTVKESILRLSNRGKVIQSREGSGRRAARYCVTPSKEVASDLPIRHRAGST